MKIAIVDSAYWGVLSRSGFTKAPQKSDSPDLLISGYEVNSSDAAVMYAKQFRLAGNEVKFIIPNSSRLQLLSLPRKKHWRAISPVWRYWQGFSRLPWPFRSIYERSTMARVLVRDLQNESYDVIFVLDPNLLTPGLAKRLKASTNAKLIGQIASPLPPTDYFLSYDAMISAHPGLVGTFEGLCLDSYFLPLAIDDSLVLPNPKEFSARPIDVSFVGSFGRHHTKSFDLFKEMAEKVPNFKVFTVTSARKLRKLGLIKNYAGAVWGASMMEVYQNSKIVLNRHIGMSAGYSVNYRMYEATASGAVLLTENSLNLPELFEPHQEVEVYSTPHEALQKVQEILSNPELGQRLSVNGRNATLTRHTMSQRAQAALEIFRKVIASEDQFDEGVRH